MYSYDRTRTADDVGMTILQQMGGAGRIKAMTGATFVRVTNGIGIKWPSKQPSKGNYVEVTLDPSDTYSMKFYNIGRGAKKVVKDIDGVYAEDLVRIFEGQTGYYLRF